jgi:preprotein translocase subunit SecA
MLKNPLIKKFTCKYQNLISQINTLENDLKSLTDSELKAFN